MEQKKITVPMWISIIVFGLFGQIAWIVENMYFNVFIDRTITPNPTAIWIMVAASAIVATIATLIGGTWSDKKGNRRTFISYGYIVWGLIIMSFSFIKVDSIQKTFGGSLTAAIAFATALVVIMDCVMTYIGSTANDAAFNAWVTDNVRSNNRGKVEGVLAVMPLIAMAVVFAGMDWMTQDTFSYVNAAGETVTRTGWIEGGTKVAMGNWTMFYCILGAMVIVAGIVGIFTLKDDKNLKPNDKVDFKDMFYGFKKDVVKENKYLYFSYISMAIVGIANNSYMTYLIMYAERTLGFSNYIIPVAIIIVTAAIGSVVFGIVMDKSKDRRKFFIPLIVTYVVGALLMFVASPIVFKAGSTVLMIAVCLAGFVLMAANLCMAAAMTSTVRDLTPPDKVGLFQGVRMVFSVMIPMVIGPLITVIINANSKQIGTDFYGAVIREYSPIMFIAAAVVGALAVFPVLKLNKASLEEMTPFIAVNTEQDKIAEIAETEVDAAV